jgi:hypothetical protein
VDQTGPLGIEQAAQSVKIKTWRVVWAHRVPPYAGVWGLIMMPTGRYVVQCGGET